MKKDCEHFEECLKYLEITLDPESEVLDCENCPAYSPSGKVKIYLAHSVHERDRGEDFQEELEKLGHIVYNPFYPDEIIRDDIEALDKGFIQPWEVVDKEKSRAICERDLKGVRNQDIVICLFPNGRTIGIPCEMFYAAHNLAMDVYSVVPEDMKGHPWIVNYSKLIFYSDEELLEYIKVNRIRQFY